MKKVGDEIAYDEPLFEVSTDKVDSEVPSPASGYLAEILVAEGETVDVGTKLAVVTDDGSLRRRPAPLRPGPRCRTASPPAPAATPEPEPASAPPEPEPAPRPEDESGPVGTSRTGRGWCCLPSSASWSPSTASTRPRCRAPAKVAGSPGRTCSRSSTVARPAPVPPATAAPAPQRAGGERRGQPRRARPRAGGRPAKRRGALVHARRGRSATRSCRSRTSGASPPSTWSGRRRRRLTPLP